MRLAGLTKVNSDTRQLLQLDSPEIWEGSSANDKSAIEKALDYGIEASRFFDTQKANALDWNATGQATKDDFTEKTGMSGNSAALLWNDINRWKSNPPPNLNGEARAATASTAILNNPIIGTYLMGIFKDTGANGRFNTISEYLIRNNLDEIKENINTTNTFEKKNKDGNINPKWTTRQQEIETELAARVARLHNGDLCATPSKTCKSNVARTGTLKEVMQADQRAVGRQYATRFLNIPNYPVNQSSDPRRQQPVGDYFSLRCVEEIPTEKVTKGGMEFMPLSI